MLSRTTRQRASWCQTQSTNADIDDGEDNRFYALGVDNDGNNASRQTFLNRNATIQSLGVFVDNNTRTVSTLFTTTIDNTPTAQVITVLTLATGFALSSVPVAYTAGLSLNMNLLTNPVDDPETAHFRGFGMEFTSP